MLAGIRSHRRKSGAALLRDHRDGGDFHLRRVTRFMEQLKSAAAGLRWTISVRACPIYYRLKNMPVDYLKIDGMFVKGGAAANSTDFSMVEPINRIGHGWVMKTIAEFAGARTSWNQ